jgi:hypothetical protein
MPRDSAAADRPASYLVGTAAAFPLFFRDRTKPINQLPFSPSAKFPKSGSSCESRVNVADTATPVAVHGVQHLVHPPRHLGAWPNGDRRSRLVFVARGLDPAMIERSFRAFSGVPHTSSK